MDQEHSQTKDNLNSNSFEDVDGYCNEFDHRVATERLNSQESIDRIPSLDRRSSSPDTNIRKSTDEFLKMKRDEFWATHKDSIEEQRLIEEAGERYEQLQFMRQIEEEQRLQHQRQESQIKQQQLLLAQQQAFKQQQMKQSQPTAPQLQALLIQIEQSRHNLQLQYTQQTQLIQHSYQPIVLKITNELNKAIQLHDTAKIQTLRLQQQSIQQQFQSQIAVLQQQFAVQSQSLQSTQLNIKNALHNALQLHSIQPLAPMQSMQAQKAVPSTKSMSEFRPSKQAQPQASNHSTDTKQIFTIQEDQIHPHIIDDNKSKNGLESDIETLREDNVSRRNSNSNTSLSYKTANSNIKHRVASQSICSQISSQSVSKSPAITATNYAISPIPSISPMKLPYVSHHPSVSAPATAPYSSIPSQLRHNPNVSTPQYHSLPNSPLFGMQSLAEISSKVSMTPPQHRKRSSTAPQYHSLPNSPFNRPRRKRKVKERLSPLILNGSDTNIKSHLEAPPPTLPKIVSTEEIHAFDGHSQSTPSNSSSSNSTEEDNDEFDEKSNSSFDDSRKGSKDSVHNSMYSYSSMSTVFTGVHDGMLLANHSVYLSHMNNNEEYNKMEVVNDIKSLWLQVFSIPLLCSVIQTLLICWFSAYGGHNNEKFKSQFAGFLLGITIFNMIAQLMIKSMTSTLSTICDELYNAACKPLIGIQLQNMIGFAFVVIMPLTMSMMLGVKYIMNHVFQHETQMLIAMNEMIKYCMFIVAPLTLFYVLQRYLEGSHVLHINGYVAACLVTSIVAELGILLILQHNMSNVYHIILIAMLCAYGVLFISFTVAIKVYKLHSETFIFKISLHHFCSIQQWLKYLSVGLYRCVLLFCMFWYFDFMIIIAGIQGQNQLIAFGILCNIYHVICSMISAAEFVAKSLIFRGLLHSSIEYARDAWKYTIFFGFFLSVIIGGIFFLLRENISKCCSANTEIQSIMNDSWLYLYILLIGNGIKYGLVGGAQAMGYIKLVSCINLFSFYIISIPIAAWTQYNHYFSSNGLHSIYLSILCGLLINIICLLIFRMYINWFRELKLFTYRQHNQAQTLQQSVEAVHIQLQQYTNAHNKLPNHNPHIGPHMHHHHHHHKRGRRHKHRHRHRLDHYDKYIRNGYEKRSTLQNQISGSFGRVHVMPLGRQRTNDTMGYSSSMTNTSTDCQCNQCGETVPKRIHVSAPLFEEKRRKRRTIWEDIFDGLKQFCCCCLFDGCCNESWNECCEGWWYYCCGCCCSESYLKDDYHYLDVGPNNNSGNQYSRTKTGSRSTPYSNYHIDINNDAKYKIMQQDEAGSKVSKRIKLLEVHGDELKHSLISHNSMAGVPADYMKASVTSQYDDECP